MSYRSAPPRVTWKNGCRRVGASRQEKNVKKSFPPRNPERTAETRMPPFFQMTVFGLALLALATGLWPGRRARWFAVLGAGAGLALALWNADPVLGLGLLAFLGARFLRGRPAPRDASPAGGRISRPRQAP